MTTQRYTKIDVNLRADLLEDGGDLRCRTCGAIETSEQTEVDPLMYIGSSFNPSTIKCDGCIELEDGWAQECDVTRWEDDQR